MCWEVKLFRLLCYSVTLQQMNEILMKQKIKMSIIANYTLGFAI